METQTTESSAIGTTLNFDENGYIIAIRAAKETLLPKIRQLAKAYEMMGLNVPFNQRLFDELMTTGIKPTKVRFEEMTANDLKGFKSPIAKQAALNQIDLYMEPLEKELESLQNLFKTFNRTSAYKFSYQDFNITSGHP